MRLTKSLAPILAGGINGIATLYLALFLYPATPVGGSEGERLSFIVGHPARVVFGWLLWILAIVALLALFRWLFLLLPHSWGRFFLVLAFIGGGVDIVANLTLMIMPGHLASLSKLHDPRVYELFHILDRATVLLTGGINNLFYGISGLFFTYLLQRSGGKRQDLPQRRFQARARSWAVASGYLTWSSALALSGTISFSLTGLLSWIVPAAFVGMAMATFLLFCLSLAILVVPAQ